EAALLYPQNANVAAAVALAGLGFDATEVELVADPDAGGNVHEIEAEGAAGRFAIQLQGKPSRSNPKTSALAAFSGARALLSEPAPIVIGHGPEAHDQRLHRERDRTRRGFSPAARPRPVRRRPRARKSPTRRDPAQFGGARPHPLDRYRRRPG